jgi:hypothetical protein
MAIERLFHFHKQTPILYYRGHYRVTDDFDDTDFDFQEYTSSFKLIMDFVSGSIPAVEEYKTLFRRTYLTFTNGILIPGKTFICKKNLEFLLKENTFSSFSDSYTRFLRELQSEVNCLNAYITAYF